MPLSSTVLDRPSSVVVRDDVFEHVTTFLFTCFRRRPGFSGTGREGDSVILYVDEAMVQEYWPAQHMGVEIILRSVPPVWCPGQAVR